MKIFSSITENVATYILKRPISILLLVDRYSKVVLTVKKYVGKNMGKYVLNVIFYLLALEFLE